AGGCPSGQVRHGDAQAHGPPGLRRCGLREDGGGHPGRLQGGARRPPGGAPGAHHRPGPATLPDVPGASGRLPDAGGDAVPVPLGRGAAGRGGRAGPGGGGHRHRHPSAAPEGRAVQGPRAGDHRRGAAVRRGPQGAPETDAPRHRCPHPLGDADTAHPLHGPRRHPRHVDDGDAAGGPAAHQDLRLGVRRPRGAGGDPAGPGARRPGVLRAQPGAQHRDDRAEGSRPSRRRAWGSHTGRCTSTTWRG
ncbi:hypothetical protein LCGC14_2340990, partial [marine sediment metagenome]